MGWQRMKSTEEIRRSEHTPIRGFLPFTEGAQVQGELIGSRMREDGSGKGYYTIRAEAPTTINVRDADSKTGQAVCAIGDVVGIRKTGATKVLSKLEIGTRVCVTYVRFAEKQSLNPKTQQMEAAMYHYVDVDVYQPDEKEVA
jgi:hypothetical protein